MTTNTRNETQIIQTFNYEDIPDGVSLDRIVFEDLGEGQSRIISTSLVDSFEGRGRLRRQWHGSRRCRRLRAAGRHPRL